MGQASKLEQNFDSKSKMYHIFFHISYKIIKYSKKDCKILISKAVEDHPVRKWKWKAENRASSNSTSQGL